MFWEGNNNMLTIEFENNKYLIQENESVLNTLLRNNVLIPYSCQSGICQSCLMKVQEGALPSDSQKGLSEEYCEEKNFLACICKPTENLKIERASNSAQILNASVKAIELKSDEILILKLKCDEDFNYKPGQFINIINENNLSRSYSLASHPNTTSLLEFHIRRCSMGKMSNWIFESLKLNDKIKIAGPNGYCFYSEKYKNKPLLLIGVGTGLSPLVGILQDAFYKSHAGEIHLVHGALNNKGLYYRKELLSYKEINNKFFSIHAF